MAYKFKTTKERSSLMGKIRSNNTKPELFFCKKLGVAGSLILGTLKNKDTEKCLQKIKGLIKEN